MTVRVPGLGNYRPHFRPAETGGWEFIYGYNRVIWRAATSALDLWRYMQSHNIYTGNCPPPQTTWWSNGR